MGLVSSQRHSFPRRLFMALAIVIVTAGLRELFQTWLGDRAAFFPFSLALLLAALLTGPVPAAIATLPALLFGIYFAAPNAFSVADAIEAGFFVTASAGIIMLTAILDRARRDAIEKDGRSEARAERADQVAEELNLLIDGAHGYAIYLLDAEGYVTIWNEGARRMKGWSEEEVIGRHTSLFYPADAVAAGKPDADLARAIAEGKLEEEDWRVRKDGSEFLAGVSIKALRGSDGEMRGFAKIVSDVTERKAAEAAILARESHVRSILSTVPDAMVVIDDRGKMLSFSAAAERLFGYDEKDVLGKNVSLLMPSPDRERHDSYIERYLATGEKRIIGIGRVVFAERKDGTTFPMELSIGEAAGVDRRLFTGFIRDLTERQKTEERLESLESELIHVSRLSAMGTMASTLAHELNQPIAAIANYTEAVRDQLAGYESEEMLMIREALDDTAKAAMRAGHIVRRLRDFVSRGDIEKTNEKLPALINEAAVLGLLGARENGITPHFDLDPYASPVLVDKVQIQQVLINLIRNAVEAMARAPEPRRILTVTSGSDQPGFVRVTVADTGPGVAPEIAEQLFTAFVSSKSDGMGLGLSICRTIVEANGGRIWMEPGRSGGTQFHFTLVRAITEDNENG